MDTKDYNIKGKKVYYQEAEIGMVRDVKKDPFSGDKFVAIIETATNGYKVVPMDYLKHRTEDLQLEGSKNIMSDFPSLSNDDIESNSPAYKHALSYHYGEADSWNVPKQQNEDDKDQEYMGSSQITNQGAEDNESLKDKMDYDKLKRGED